MSFNLMYQPLVKNVTASTLVFTGKGYLNQIIVNSHSSGVIALSDGTNAVLNLTHSSMTLASGERWIPFNGEVHTTGLYVQIGGTADITIQYRLNS